MSERTYVETGFRFIGGDIEFYCDAKKYAGIADDDNVYVSGSFNGWLCTADAAWLLTKKTDGGCVRYTLKKDFSQVNIPGNTGFPEFMFFTVSRSAYRALKDAPEPESHSFLKNKLILKDEDDVAELKRIKALELTREIKTFNLAASEDCSDIANFRMVPGTVCLYRGYHPFKQSMPALNTENIRLDCVQKQLAKCEVQSIISLSGYERARAALGEAMSALVQAAERAGNSLTLNLDYNLVYYHADAAEYSHALQRLSRFMLTHPAPFYMHCRLGIDRTGMTSAVFAALCGASWQMIADDYERSWRTGVGEYRSRRLLQYSFRNMTGEDPAVAADLEALMRAHFIREHILDDAELARLIERLKNGAHKVQAASDGIEPISLADI